MGILMRLSDGVTVVMLAQYEGYQAKERQNFHNIYLTV